MTTLRRAALAAALLLLAAAASGHAQTYARTRLFNAAGKTIGSAAISPNGRWLLFDLAENEAESALWIQPLAGGEPFRITSPGQYDMTPHWSPTGDQVFFLSTRAARAEPRLSYVMSMPVDPATGRAAGPPRQVTLDPVVFFCVSPDGGMLAYVTDSRPGVLLRVLPADGGAARTLDTLQFATRTLGFTPDGKSVLYAPRVRSVPRVLLRVGVQGGPAEEIMRVQKTITQIAPDGEHVILWATGPGLREYAYEVVSLSGELRARIPAVQAMNLSGVAPGGRALIVTQPDVVAPTRVMPVAGGAYRQVTEPNSYDWVGGWSADSRTVYSLTEADGQPAFRLQPVDGTQPRSIPGIGATPTARWFAAGPGITVFTEPGREPGTQRLIGLDLATNRRTVLAAHAPASILARWVAGPGGTVSMNGDEVLWYERAGGRIEVRGGRLDGSRRLVRAVPDTVRLGYFAVHGNRVAWTQETGEGQYDLLLANGPTSPPRRVLRGGRIGEIAFSPDGRWIGMNYATPTAPGALAIIAPEATEQTQPARILDTGALYSYWLRWLPDNSALLVIGGGAGTHTDVIMVPLREGEKPVAITRDDPSPRWGYEVSPDGRYIAYAGEVWRGSAIWKIDLNGMRIGPDR
ncbi:MAG: hypothetical protein FIB01_13170 [Gemmatimonadetes bacterium]|nr:hypothetical protein [Gemmatimonadota bacterium]